MEKSNKAKSWSFEKTFKLTKQDREKREKKNQYQEWKNCRLNGDYVLKDKELL